MKKIQVILEKMNESWKLRINKFESFHGSGVSNTQLKYPSEIFNSESEAKIYAHKYLFEELKELDGQNITEEDIEYKIKGE